MAVLLKGGGVQKHAMALRARDCVGGGEPCSPM